MLRVPLIVLAVRWITINSSTLKSGKSLYLTKYLDDGLMEEGRNAAKVVNFFEGVKSYSGLLTVDKEKKSNMFFWYFPAEQRAETAPLVICLDGYATPSTVLIFATQGPFIIENSRLKRSDLSWQKHYHTIFIDNPVGVGYSFTESLKGFSNNLKEIVTNLYEALSQFYQLFPELKANDLYISGVSLGGNYASGLAYKIFKSNQKQSAKIKLKGIFLGNPYLDPSQISYGEYLYEHGFIDLTVKLILDEKEKNMERDIKTRDYDSFFDKARTDFISKTNNYVLNTTCFNSMYDNNVFNVNNTRTIEFIEKPENKKELHVGDLKFNNGSFAMGHLAQLFGFSVKPWLEEMLSSIKMVFYNGQRDIALAYPKMTQILSSLKWSGADGYRSADRIRLYNGSRLSGYVRTYHGLTDALVFDAGHVAVYDQPQLVFNLFNNLTGYNIS